MNTQGEKKHLIVFEPSGLRGHVSEGKTILEAAQELGVDLQNVCGGQAQCGKCKVMIVEGSLQQHDIASSVHNLSSMEEEEKKFFVGQEQSNGWRLACQARIEGDVAVFVPDESRAHRQIIAKEPGKRTIDLKPAVKRYCLELIPADLDDLTAAWERLKAALRKKFGLINLKADYKVLCNLHKAISVVTGR